MNNPESLREFTNQLVRRGLPVDYASRAAEELADHHRDLAEELEDSGMAPEAAVVSASERLGERKSLIKKTVREFQRRHWCGRWRVVTFLFGPLVLLFATWIVTWLGLAMVGKMLEAVGVPGPESSRHLSTAGLVVLYTVVGWCLFAMPVLVVIVLSRWTIRCGLNGRWVVLSAMVLAISVGSIECGFEGEESIHSEIAAQHPFMVKIPAWYASTHDTQQLAQLALPLIAATYLVWRKHRSQEYAINSSPAC